VKLCVASRPWNSFEDAFKRRPSLLLQHLSKPDIEAYVTGHFRVNNHFIRLQNSEPAIASALLQSIVQKASGVFLWVHLVVQSLLEGLSNEDRLHYLHSRLAGLPPDLEDLFAKLLGSLQSEYFKQACETFWLLRTYREISRQARGCWQ
jgi:hypothetical protein